MAILRADSAGSLSGLDSHGRLSAVQGRASASVAPSGEASDALSQVGETDKTPELDVLDVLIVGAGPTGLSLAAQMNSFGVRFRLIDRALDRAHESRALGVQARTLEILQNLELGDALVARGTTSARVTMHIEGRVAAAVELAGFAAADTRYPFILFVSQAETEALLVRHLSSCGVEVERSVELLSFVENASSVACTLAAGDGRQERVRARYLVDATARTAP